MDPRTSKIRLPLLKELPQLWTLLRVRLPQLFCHKCAFLDCLHVHTTSDKVVQDEMPGAMPSNVKSSGSVASGHMPKDLAIEGLAIGMWCCMTLAEVA